MKLRTGFVSNSSSSSFVVVVTEQAHLAAMSKLSEYGRAIVNDMMGTHRLGNQTLYMGGHYTSASGYLTFEWLQEKHGANPDFECTDPECKEYDECYCEDRGPRGMWNRYLDLVGHDNYISTCVGDEG